MKTYITDKITSILCNYYNDTELSRQDVLNKFKKCKKEDISQWIIDAFDNGFFNTDSIAKIGFLNNEPNRRRAIKMKRPTDFNPINFKEYAKDLPEECFKQALQEAFFLSTNKDADPFEKERFDLLHEAAKERGLRVLL